MVGVLGRCWVLPRKAEPAQSTYPSRSHGKRICKGKIMQELEIIDLGDAVLETKCTAVPGPGYDFFYGPSQYSC